MSDYLWDKTGEPDAEVERLEELLGKLRHSPRALELPPDVEMDAARSPRFLRPAWLAVAAALLLAIMAVAFVALRAEKTKGVNDSASQVVPSPPRQVASPQSAPPQLAATPGTKPAPQPEILYVGAKDKGASQKQGARRGGERPVVVKPEQGLVPVAGNSTKEDESIAVETSYRVRAGRFLERLSAGVAAQQQLTKEQLVYALRLTNSKLKDVRKKSQGIVDSKSSFDERNRNK